jgi:DeoR family transcriptional regulator of aga operon
VSPDPAPVRAQPAPDPSAAPADPGAADPDGRGRGQRWGDLLELLADRRRLSVAETAVELGVSEATIRRDFAALAQAQLATRTHGGVVATGAAYELPARYRSGGVEPERKERIAAAAAALCEPGSVVGFNGGTTTTAVARRLAVRPDLARGGPEPSITVVTNALNIATEMVLRPHVRTVILGGIARPRSYELVGPLAALVLDELWLDTLVLGVDGFDAVGGATCHHEGEAGVDAHMVRRARRVLVVTTSDKLGRRTFARICPAASVHTVITDSAAAPAAVDELTAAGVTVHQV